MALDLLQWRRETFDNYAAVRAASDPAAAWVEWRNRRDRLFATHPASPLEERDGFTGLPYAPYDPALRFAASVADVSPARRDVPTSDGIVPLERVGRVELPIGTLDVWWIACYGGGLFVPFADESNGDTSYGGGRYLIDTIKGADLGSAGDRMVLDLNFAYHPSCRYSGRWSCPLPFEGNRLPVRVDAGEQLS
jgi:uncharacterized protein (DUF1684 family)